MRANELYGDSQKYFAIHPHETKLASARKVVGEASRRVSGSHRLLDIGSGRGEILAAAKEAEIEAIGLEVSEPFAAESVERFGVDVRLQTLEEFNADNNERFSIIIMNAVLEHVPNPDSLIKTAADLLSTNGIVRIDVPREPNLMSLTATALSRFRGRRINYYLSPTWEPYHLHGFSPRPLRTLLAKHGLDIRELHVRARPRIPTDGTINDKLRSVGGGALLAIGNATRLSSNMDLWAVRIGK